MCGEWGFDYNDRMASDGVPRHPSTSDLVEKLRAWFARYDDVALAFLFGSRAKGTARQDSDVDVAVYFISTAGWFDLEQDGEDDPDRGSRRIAVDRIQAAVEEAARTEADVVVLNNAPATVVSAALREGIPLLVRDRGLYWRLLLVSGRLAEDEVELVEDFAAIKARSRSLSRVDRARLLRLLDFLERELAEAATFVPLTRHGYESQGSLRRDVERWTENVVNASVDLAKIVLASSGARIPETYREALRDLADLPSFPREAALRAAAFTRLRNVLAHDYLEVRYPEIRRFVEEAPGLYPSLIAAARAWLAAQAEADT